MKRISMLLLFFFILSLAVNAQNKRALIIGIGQQEDPAWSKINGDKDIPYVEKLLAKSGFKSIIKLVNKQATKSGIVKSFILLTKECESGDIVYIHYSGHGQQMKDVHNDEKDGLDECWIPYDAYRKPCNKDMGEKHLSDDEINHYLNVLRNKVGDKGKLLVIIDACHSGDATRGDDDEVIRGVEDIFETIKSYFIGCSENKHTKEINPNANPNAERWITISACESDQVNIEMKKPVVGKLTYALYKTLNENPTKNNYDFFRRIKLFINTHTGSRPQYPVLSGEINRYKITDVLR